MKTQMVCGFLFSTNGKRLCVIQKNRPEFLAGKLLPPGGKIEPTDDCPKHAMIREFQEEVGVQIRKWQFFATLQCGDVEVHCYMVFSDHLLFKVKTMTDEIVSVIEVDNLPANMLPNARWLITMALSFKAGEHASSFQIQEVYA